MHNISFEESRTRVPLGVPGGVFIYRLHTEFSQFVMDVVENIRKHGLQRAVILVQKGVPKATVDDATQRISELLERRDPTCRTGSVASSESEKRSKEGQNIALECFHDLTRADLRRLKRQWGRTRK